MDAQVPRVQEAQERLVNIVNMPDEIFIISNTVLPKPSLPYSSIAFQYPTFSAKFFGGYLTGETTFY
jgi:hypothetical protein